MHGRIQQPGTVDAQVFACEVEAFAVVAARNDFAPDPDKFSRLFIALGMVQADTVPFEFSLVAACDQVDQQPAARQPVKRCRHAGRQAGLVQARPHGDQELEVFGDRQQAGSHHPGVFAGTAGGNQDAFITQCVGGYGDLLEVIQTDFAGTFAGAKVAAVAMGGNEPENLHVCTPC